jgi:hypothetical protein
MSLTREQKTMLVAASVIYGEFGDALNEGASQIAEKGDHDGMVGLPIRAFMAMHLITNMLMNHAMDSGLLTHSDFVAAMTKREEIKDNAEEVFADLMKRVATRH